MHPALLVVLPLLSAPANDSTESFKMVVITDWHTNPYYNTSIGRKCLCTQLPGDVVEPSCILPSPASRFGQYGCDSPPPLAAASLSAAAAAVPDADLVLVLGDLVMHHSPDAAADHRMFADMSKRIQEAFPSRPFACQTPLGNNDVFPNYAVNNSDTNFYAPQARAARLYCGVGDAEASGFAAKGYYARQLLPRARLLILNTNIYASVHAIMATEQKLGHETTSARLASVVRSRRHLDVLRASARAGARETERDPLGQFKWMRQHMEWARRTGGKVYIAAHIPPVLDSYVRMQQWEPSFARRYWALVAEFADVLGLHIFGHVHAAEVRASGDPQLRAAPALQTLASVSPIFSSNPSIYTLHATPNVGRSNLTLHSFNLSAAAHLSARVPTTLGQLSFTPMVQRPLDSTRGFVASNSAYRQLFAGLLTMSLNESARAQFDSFFDLFKGGHHGRGLECTRYEDTFQDCATCTGNCRVAFVCLQMSGTDADDYAACVKEHSLPPQTA